MEAIGNLTGGLARDFNDLLGATIGNPDMIRASRAPAPQTAGWSQMHSTRCCGATRWLPAFARRQRLAPANIAINHLVTSIVDVMRRVFGGDISINVELGDLMLAGECGPGAARSAILNPANNPRDAMPKPRLMITTGNGHLDANCAALHPGAGVGRLLDDRGHQHGKRHYT